MSDAQITAAVSIGFVAAIAGVVTYIAARSKRPEPAQVGASTVAEEQTIPRQWCPSCGAELPLDVRFCPSCGTKAESIDSQRPAKCLACDARLNGDEGFCPLCGAKTASRKILQPAKKERPLEAKIFLGIMAVIVVIFCIWMFIDGLVRLDSSL